MREGWPPGRISWWAALRFGPPRPFRWPWGSAALIVVCVHFATRGGVLGILIAVAAGISAVDSVLSRVLNARRPYGEVRVTGESQPQLFAVIEQAAAGVGVDAPRQVWLADGHRITARVHRSGYDLVIGLPLLAVLAVPELRAVLAHQLAEVTFPRPHRVIALVGRWRTAASTQPHDRQTRRLARAEPVLRAAALPVERAADAAAVAAAGERALAARAFVVSAALSPALFDLHGELRPPTGWGLEDVDDAWRRAVAEGLPSWWWDQREAENLARAHPDLAEAIRSLGADALVLRGPRDVVTLRPLGLSERRRLAAAFFELRSGHEPARWVTVDAAPLEWWAARARRGVDGLRSNVAAVIGREPVDPVELAEQFLRHRPELLRRALAKFGAHGDDASDAPDDRELPPILVDLLEDALLARGWRLKHPAVRGVLIGPQGERVDGRTLTPQTYVDTLRSLLDGAALAPP
jgi:hypothetical protein